MRPSCILIAFAILTSGCGGGEEGEEDLEIRISATATPLSEVTEYGSVVRILFTLTNENSFPVFIDRAETLEGYRLTLADLARPRPRGEGTGWVHSGLLLPNQKLDIEAPHRVIVPKERILLTVRPVTRDELPGLIRFLVQGREIAATEDLIEDFAGRQHPVLRPPIAGTSRAVLLGMSGSRRRLPETMAMVTLPCPEPPFDPWAKGASGKAWTWSTALSGFVFRPSGTDAQLFRADGMTPLPPVPFEFLRDLDYFEKGVAVFDRSHRRRVVTPETLQALFTDLRSSRGHLEIGDDPGKPGRPAYLVR